mgnify:FL=1
MKLKMEEDLICEDKELHQNELYEAKKKEITQEMNRSLAEMFKVFADETRLRIICSLLNEELCVCDLCELLNLNQSTVSHQLQTLRTSKLVKYRKEGKQVYYTLEDEHIDAILRMAIAHIKEKENVSR